MVEEKLTSIAARALCLSGSSRSYFWSISTLSDPPSSFGSPALLTPRRSSLYSVLKVEFRLQAVSSFHPVGPLPVPIFFFFGLCSGSLVGCDPFLQNKVAVHLTSFTTLPFSADLLSLLVFLDSCSFFRQRQLPAGTFGGPHPQDPCPFVPPQSRSVSYIQIIPPRKKGGFSSLSGLRWGFICFLFTFAREPWPLPFLFCFPCCGFF